MLKLNCNCDDFERTIKNVYVFVNGAKYSGQKVVLNQKRWHHILNEITLKLDPYFGKVEKLYSTTSGLTVRSFTDLQNNATYVASNRARKYSHVKGGYTIDTDRTQEYFEHYLSSQLQRVNKCKKLLYVRRDLLVIYIFRNGECGRSFKIVLTSEDLSSWSHILSYVALIIDVPERCIKSLYSVSGNRICGPWELQHGASYVAVGYNESFRKGCYHVTQKSTEMLTTGFPVVPKDKNLACKHKGKRKMKQNFRWNHYDQYTCDVPLQKGFRKSRSGSKKSKRYGSQSEPANEGAEDDEEVSEGAAKSKPNAEEGVSEGTANNAPKKNKKVTVHMRIKNSQASNLTITRNSEDSSPTRNGKKKWIDEDSSDNENDAHSSMCTSPETCTETKGNKHAEDQSEPDSQTISEIEIETPQNGRNLTWKHVKKSESEKEENKTEKVTVKLRSGKASIIDGTSSESSFKNKVFSKNKKIKSEDNNGHKSSGKSKKSDYESTLDVKKKKKNSSTSYNEKNTDKCRAYRYLKPAMDTFKPSYCQNTPASTKPKVKFNNTILKLNRDQSESRIKNRNSRIPCENAEKCKADKRSSIIKKMCSILCDSLTSIDSLKSRPTQNETSDSTDSEDFYGLKNKEESRKHSQQNSAPQNKSSCTICRIQKERRNINKGY